MMILTESSIPTLLCSTGTSLDEARVRGEAGGRSAFPQHLQLLRDVYSCALECAALMLGPAGMLTSQEIVVYRGTRYYVN